MKQQPVICLHIECVQAAHVARLEHLSDVVVCLESFVGTPMESDSTFKAYNGTSSFCFVCNLDYIFIAILVHIFLLLLIKNNVVSVYSFAFSCSIKVDANEITLKQIFCVKYISDR